MSQIVRCEICNGIYNEKYINSHRRLAHTRGRIPGGFERSKPDTLETIVAMYVQLPEKERRAVRERLASADQLAT